MQCALLPVEVSVLGVLHLCIPNPGIQEQTVEEFLFVVHGCKHVLEFLLRVGLRWLFGVIEFRKNLAGNKNVPSSQEGVQRFEDIVDGAVIKVAVMFSKKLHVPEKLVAVNLV